MPARALLRSNETELRILNLVNPVNLAILSKSSTRLQDSQDLPDGSIARLRILKILFGPNTQRVVEFDLK
jgi:hypothetical protein